MEKRVFIVEDSPSVRSRLVDLLRPVEYVHIVGEAETPADAVQGILVTHPDYVVLDFQLIGGVGIEVLRAVHAQAPEIQFIVLTNHPHPQYRRLCMDSGAHYFFDKSTEFIRVRDVIRDTDPISINDIPNRVTTI